MANEIIITKDSRPYKSLITDIGNAKMTRAVLDGRKVNIVEMRLGDGGGGYYMPTTAATALVNEVWAGEIASKTINEASPNIIAVKTVIPSSVGGFTIREASLHDDEGDMIAVCNMPDIGKATLPDGISSSLDIIMNILLTNVDAVEFVINPTLDPASRDDLEKAMAAHNSDPNAHNGARLAVLQVTIPKEGWAGVGSAATPGTGEPGDTDPGDVEPGDGEHVGGDTTESGGMYVDIPLEGVTEAMIPDLSIYQADMDTARQCGMSTSVRTLDGVLRVYAQEAPAAEIRASLALQVAGGVIMSGGGGTPAAGIGQGLTYTADGKLAAKIGDGLAFDGNGAVVVDGAALSEDAAEALAEKLTESDENAAKMIDEVYG